MAQLGVGLGLPEPPFKEEVLPVLLAMLDEPRNADPKMLMTLISALGHLHDERTATPVVQFKNHPEEDVRYHVAISLGGLESDIAIKALIELSEDEDSDVRDWATFGLGSLAELDTPEIRTALLNRLNDSDDDTRNEAIKGLAQRRDERVVTVLIRDLAGANPHGLAFEAAYELAHPVLLPTLLEYQKANQDLGVENEELNEAIAKCRANLT